MQIIFAFGTSNVGIVVANNRVIFIHLESEIYGFESIMLSLEYDDGVCLQTQTFIFKSRKYQQVK